MSDFVRNCLGLNNIKTAVLGCTIIDTNNEVGLCTEGNSMSMPRHNRQNIFCPNEALSFYPAVEQSEVDNEEDSDMLALGAMWFNGFIPFSRGITDPENCCHATATMMSRYGVVTSDQILKSRPDSWLECIYSAFKWYGKNDERLVPQEMQSDTAIGKIVRKGFVHPNWLVKPISVRYMVKELADEDGRDYVYLVGGSDFLLGDSSKDICQAIGDKIKTVKQLLASEEKVPNEISNNLELTDVYNVWNQFDIDKYGSDFMNNPYTKAKLLTREVNRAIQGVIMIRNYFKYAQKYLGVKTVFDAKEMEKIDVQIVIDRYDTAYKFVRNLSNCEESIGHGEL